MKKRFPLLLVAVVIFSLVMSACGGAAPQPEEGPIPLEFRLNWTLYGEHAPFFLGVDKGLGYLLLVANSNLLTALMFGTIFALTVQGLILFYIIQVLESWLIPWHITVRSGQQEHGTM